MNNIEKGKISKDMKFFINKNIVHSRHGYYKYCETGRAIKTTTVSHMNLQAPDNICSVFVINQHVIDVMSQFCNKGFNVESMQGINPCAMSVVGRDFYGTNFESFEGLRDSVYNLRTNFNATVTQHNPYPIKDRECIWNKYVTVIRDNNMKFLPYNQIYRFGLITTSPINKPQLIDDATMASEYYLKTLENIECVFQTAISGNYNILVLTPFGSNEDEMPQEDIVKIYNYCIYKYGFRFKYVICAVPPSEKKTVFELYHKGLIRPQEMTKHIDEKYENKKSKLNIKSGKKDGKTSSVTQEKQTIDPITLQMFLNTMRNK